MVRQVVALEELANYAVPKSMWAALKDPRLLCRHCYGAIKVARVTLFAIKRWEHEPFVFPLTPCSQPLRCLMCTRFAKHFSPDGSNFNRPLSSFGFRWASAQLGFFLKTP